MKDLSWSYEELGLEIVVISLEIFLEDKYTRCCGCDWRLIYSGSLNCWCWVRNSVELRRGRKKMIPEVVSGVPTHELYDQLKMSGKNVRIKLKCCLKSNNLLSVHTLPPKIFFLYTGTWAPADNQIFHAVLQEPILRTLQHCLHLAAAVPESPHCYKVNK